MQPSYIKLTYRYIIDAAAQDQFSKAVLRLSHEEFKMKSQAYNTEGKFSTFTEMKANDGRANSLHYKCSFAVSGLMQTLNKKNPFLADVLNRPFEFETFSFEVIESDINDINLHKIAVHFITGELQLVSSIGDALVLSNPAAEADPESGFKEAVTIRMQEGLAVSAYK